MNQAHRTNPVSAGKAILITAFLIGAWASEAKAQWEWAKSVGVSGTTYWGAAALGKDGDFYVGGMSDKLPGAQVRGFVMARYSDSVAAKWNTKLLGGTGANIGLTTLGVDSAGGSYMVDKWGTTPLTLPDSTQITHIQPTYFVSRYLPDGKPECARET